MLVQITRFTSPCETVRAAFLDGAYSRVSETRHPGWSRVYARVLVPGEIAAGDRVERLNRPRRRRTLSPRAWRRTVTIVDLSLPIRPHVRWKTEVTVLSEFEDPSHPFRSSRLAMPGHGFTHCDGFSHFIPGGTPVDRMPIETWVGEAAVVDLTHVGANTAIEAADLEARGQHVRRGDIALLRTDWPRRQSWETLAFWTEAPWTGLSACRWLVARGVKAVGYDYPPDQPVRDLVTGRRRPIAPEEWATHHTFFPAGIGVIEYLVNLDRLGRDRVRFAALPLRLEGGDGAPARAIAILD